MKLLRLYLLMTIFLTHKCHSTDPSQNSTNRTVSYPTINASDTIVHPSDLEIVIIAQDGNVTASKKAMKECSFPFKIRLENGTIDYVHVRFPAKIVQKVVEFCKGGSTDIDNDADALYDFAFMWDITTLYKYLYNKEEMEKAGQLAEDKRRQEAATQETSSSNKNLYAIKILMLSQIPLLCIHRIFNF